MATDERPKELRFDWVQIGGADLFPGQHTKRPWHVTDEGNPNQVWCNGVTGVVRRKMPGLINNPGAWTQRICPDCMNQVWERVYDYSLATPKEGSQRVGGGES